MGKDKPRPNVPHITGAMITEVLRSLGPGPGDSVFAHNSLSRFGWVEGGAEAVCRAYIDAVSPEGTVIMPAFTFGLINKPDAVLDLANEPSCVGRIPEIFRIRFATHRSRHITHPVSAAGPKADYFTAGHSRDAFDENSAFRRLVDDRGYVVLNGVDYNACTFFHCIEYALPVPYIGMIEKPDAYILLADGQVIPANCRVHHPTMPYDFNRMAKLLEGENLTRIATCGNSIIRCFDAAAVFYRVLAELQRDPLALALEEGMRLRIPVSIAPD
ncbi:MAG: AAC(3) family N-acetyltransferase [Phycisphaerae bacterium]|jgi:aminoglycoside 3-N-acetyltransferase|nr:AAC(3) family N-acetyltransferase [Phycisphaerae bacterium]